MMTLRAKNESLSIELKELRERLVAAEKSRDLYVILTHYLNKQLCKAIRLTKCPYRYKNNQSRVAASSVANTTNLASENSKLQSDIAELEKEIWDFEGNITYYIADLDLAQAGFRVLNCRHDDFGAIPDCFHTTREKTAGVIAHALFHEYAHDADFMKQYLTARGTTLDHYRAHERVNQGRADWSDTRKQELMRVEGRRDVRPTYH